MYLMYLKMTEAENQNLRGLDFDKISVFLSDEEYEKIDSLIGEKHQTLIALHAKLFITDFNTISRTKEGILCIVLSIKNETTTFSLYDVNENILLWNKDTPEKPEDYVTLENNFHLFRPEDSLFHFKFRNDEEGKAFENVIRNLKPISPTDKISIRGTLQLKYRRKSLGQFSKSESDLTSLFEDENENKKSKVRINDGANKTETQPVDKKKKNKFRKIRKEDIGQPQDLRHLAHVGYDANKGLNYYGEEFLEPKVREIFLKAGISRGQMRNTESIKQAIVDYAEARSSLEEAKEAINGTPRNTLTSIQPPPDVIKPAVRVLPKVMLNETSDQQNAASEKPAREVGPKTKILVNYLRTKIVDSEELRKSLAAPPPPPSKRSTSLDMIEAPTFVQNPDSSEREAGSEKTLNVETPPAERVSFSTLPRKKDTEFPERNSVERPRSTFIIRPAPPLPSAPPKTFVNLEGKAPTNNELKDKSTVQKETKKVSETDNTEEIELPKPVPAPRRKASSYADQN